MIGYEKYVRYITNFTINILQTCIYNILRVEFQNIDTRIYNYLSFKFKINNNNSDIVMILL